MTTAIRSVDDQHSPLYHGDDVNGAACFGRMNFYFTSNVRPICYGPTHPLEQYGGPAGRAKWLKDNNKTDMGDASVDDFNKFMADEDNRQERVIDETATRWAERTMTELGSELYTSESQQREVRSADHLPEGLREKMGVQ